YTVIPHEVAGHSDEIRLAGTADDAKRLLGEAGYPQGRGFPPITLTVRGTTEETLFGQIAQAIWKEQLGVEVKVAQLELQAFGNFVEAAHNQPFGMVNLSATADTSDP